MSCRRRFLASAFALSCLSAPTTYSQSVPVASESVLRETIERYYASWNRHDAAAWGEFLTADVHWMFPYANSKQSREAVVDYGAHLMKMYDSKFEVVRLRLYDNGNRATVILRGQHLDLPLRDGKYLRAWNRDPVIARWRVDGGSWRLYYMNENTTEAAALAKAEGLE